MALDLKEKLQERIARFRESWKGALTISSELGEGSINASPDLVDILLDNLFSNAGKHNVAHGCVIVRLTDTAMEIKNTGQPVPLDAARLFQRFYKSRESSGLGLSIVKEICDLSGIGLSYSYSESTHAFVLRWGAPGGRGGLSSGGAAR